MHVWAKRIIGMSGRMNSRSRGQIVVMFAFGLVALMGCVAMAVDVGMLVTTRRNYQKVADTCATVGAQAVAVGAAVTRAEQCVTSNNVPDGFTVNLPPSSGVYQGNNKFLEVRINRSAPTAFMRALGIGSVPIGVRAVASASRSMNYAVVGLRPGNGNNSVRSAGGSNSNIIGNACSAGDFQVSGTLNLTGWGVANGSFQGVPDVPDTRMESGALSDPCLDPAYPLPPIPTPQTLSGAGTVSVSGVTCPVFPASYTVPSGANVNINCTGANPGTVNISGPRNSVSVSGSNKATVALLSSGLPSNATFKNVDIKGKGAVTLAPGWYDTISLTSDGHVTLDPGLYLVNSSYDQSGGGDLNGSNVSIVVGHQFSTTGNGDVHLSCCATGMPNNVLLYHYGKELPGSLWPASGPNALAIMGNSSTRTLDGNIYSPLSAPCDTPCVQVGGASTLMTINGQVAAPVVEMNGNGLKINFPDNTDNNIPRPYLAE
jgi:Putative Flp pilus-assembly TadE/G-like